MIPVYRAQSFMQLLTLIQNSRTRGSGRFSYRQLADKLGYRSPRSIAMVHKGQRLPNHSLVRRLVVKFDFSPHETELIFLLVEKAYAQKQMKSILEIDKKILALSSFIENQMLPKTEPNKNERFLYLKPDELKNAQEEIETFFVKLKSKYSQQEATERSQLVKLRVVLENS